MHKRERQQKLSQLILLKKLANQNELQTALLELGVHTNQATVSRDLAELGVIKVRGFYQMPQIMQGQGRLVDTLHIAPAGDNLLVIRTAIGQAQMIAAVIDGLKLDGALGTVAGDDTLFVAIPDRTAQIYVTKEILAHFSR